MNDRKVGKKCEDTVCTKKLCIKCKCIKPLYFKLKTREMITGVGLCLKTSSIIVPVITRKQYKEDEEVL